MPRAGTKKVSQLLRDMRKVYSQAAHHSETVGQVRLRKMLNEDPKGYMQQLVQLEKAHAARKVSPPAQVKGKLKRRSEREDAGAVAAGMVLEKLLGEWEQCPGSTAGGAGGTRTS